MIQQRRTNKISDKINLITVLLQSNIHSLAAKDLCDVVVDDRATHTRRAAGELFHFRLPFLC